MPEEVPLLVTVTALVVPVVLVVFIKNGWPGEFTLKVSVSPSKIFIEGSFPEKAPDNI